jgi:hypothetical protein
MALMITSMSPTNLLTGQSKEIWLGGYGFFGQVLVLVNNIAIPTFFSGNNLIKFVLPYIPAGVYAITVINPDQTQFVLRPGITITDPPAGVSVGPVGSAQMPIVLPPQIVESSCNAAVNSSVNNAKYRSPAAVYTDPTSGNTIAVKRLDSSSVATEPFTGDQTYPNPSAGSHISTPFGTFGN